MSELPPSPDLELLRKRAKELLGAARAGDPAALARCRSAAPRLARLDDQALRVEVRLADTQHAVAREQGAASWPRLRRELEAAQPLAQAAERFLAAVRQGSARGAERLLRQRPEVAVADVWCAAAAGEVAALRAALDAAPALLAAPHPDDGWTPLLYACRSELHRRSAAVAAAVRRGAELLLDRGADPNAFTLWDGGDAESRLPALYRACVADHAALVRLLLERGADPDDGESVYHAAELDHRGCLEALAAHGAPLSRAHPRWKNTPLYFLAGYKEFHPGRVRATRGMQWLLEHGADPRVPSTDARETPLHRVAAHGRGPEVAELLLRHGAEVDQARADGRTAYALAVRTGNAAMADELRRRGADTTRLTPVDELLGASLAGDAAAARSLLARRPDVLRELDSEDRQAPALAAEEGRDAALRLMVELGFDLRWEHAWGGTPLHHAAWHGRPGTVRTLLALGAPVTTRDSTYGSSPLAWAAHGSANCRRADDDYCAVVELLIDAGADRETAINRWGEPPESMASRRVAALLRRRGGATA
jgi:ankyrin repeat protein